MSTMEELEARQRRLDNLFRIIFFSIVILLIVGIGALFVQVYSLSAQINTQVDKIVDNQTKNRSITDKQNSLVLGYLICIGKIAPEDRTDAIIRACVEQAQRIDIRDL